MYKQRHDEIFVHEGISKTRLTRTPGAALDDAPWASPDVRSALDPIVPMDPADQELLEQERNAHPELFSNTDSPQTVSDPMGEALEKARAENARWVNGDGPEEAPQWVPEPEAPARFADDDIPESIAALMAADRTLTLTEAFRRRINTLNNARLNLTIKPEQTAELDALLERFTELAQRGDRS